MCAGPYGHLLLNIEEEQSQKYQKIIQQGIIGIKPGWCRINFHYLFSEVEFEFVCQAIEFIANYGYLFLSEYTFNLHSGEWNNRNFKETFTNEKPNIESVLKLSLDDCFEEESIDREELYVDYLNEAKKIVKTLKKDKNYSQFTDPAAEELRWFNFIHLG